MSWDNLPEPIREAAEQALTREQLEALKLWEDGCGYTVIGRLLHISPSSAAGRIHRALRAIELHLERAA